ncbi:MAG: alpha/beta hydrolase, partial [Chloroflexota bacterium]|nr:alpha/beta hydrolase [Chloroflexota bacterium]
ATPRVGQRPADSGPVPRFEPTDCRTDWLSGRSTTCGDLIVLEDRARPDGARIALHVAIHSSWSGQPAPDPVVYLDGGPGGSPLVDGFYDHPFLEDRDLIVFDQRGVGLSRPSLDCPEVIFLFLREELDALRDCHRRLIEEGVQLEAYDSVANAADLEDLRTVLGHDQWNLYGVSYGSRLALTAMRDHPAGIRSVVLDGVYPPEVDLYAEGARNAQRAFDELFIACGADHACFQAFPDLQDRFYLLVEQLNAEPLTAGSLLGLGGTDIDGSTLLWLVHQRMYATEYLAGIPAALDAFSRDEWEELDEWLFELVGFGRAGGYHVLSEGFHYSVQCAEELAFSDQQRLGEYDLAVVPVVSFAFDWHYMVEACELWDVPPADAVENQPVVSDIPALLLAGTYDPVTPPAWAQTAAQNLSAGQVVVLRGVGHGSLGSSWCVDDIVARFLDEPLALVDHGCVDELGEPEFVTPGVLDD